MDEQAQAEFDRFIFDHETDITVPTARALAKDLGVWFEPDYYYPDAPFKVTS